MQVPGCRGGLAVGHGFFWQVSVKGLPLYQEVTHQMVMNECKWPCSCDSFFETPKRGSCNSSLLCTTLLQLLYEYSS